MSDYKSLSLLVLFIKYSLLLNAEVITILVSRLSFCTPQSTIYKIDTRHINYQITGRKYNKFTNAGFGSCRIYSKSTTITGNYITTMKVQIDKFLIRKLNTRSYSMFLAALNIAFLMSSCSSKVISKNSTKPVTIKKPIYQADPSIFHYKGTYYLFGTNDNNSDSGFVVYSSKDMTNWVLNGRALSRGDSYGDWGFWAPQVFEHRGKFYMAYTANERISVAESNSPGGPFKQAVKQPIVSTFRQIDPFIFIDDDGKKYLYHVRLDKGNHIYVAEMNDDFLSVKPETYKQCITATSMTWEHVDSASVKIAEGPTVVKKNGLYYLFYAVNDFRNKEYAVGYAVSNNVYGPWKRYSGNPLISSKITGHVGSGHGDIVQGKGKRIYYVFHTHNANNKVGPRKTAMVEMKFTKSDNGEFEFVVDKGSFRYLSVSQ